MSKKESIITKKMRELTEQEEKLFLKLSSIEKEAVHNITTDILAHHPHPAIKEYKPRTKHLKQIKELTQEEEKLFKKLAEMESD